MHAELVAMDCSHGVPRLLLYAMLFMGKHDDSASTDAKNETRKAGE